MRTGGSGDRRPGFFRGLATGAILAVLALALIAPLREALLPQAGTGDRLGEALGVIERSYYEEVDPTEIEDASIEGMVRQLRRENRDRFSHYFDPETYERFRSATSGQFSGVGMTVSEVNRGLRVARVFADTPAEDGGLQIGDVVTAVDGDSIAGESAEAASARIKGEPGTSVELTVLDPESGDRRDVELERAEVRIPAVDGELRRADGERLGYVALTAFTNGAHGELRQLVEGLYEDGAEGLVLDLRGNGGGLLQEAVLVTSIFLEEGPIVTTEGRTRASRTLEANGEAIEPRPMAVLTNGDTASASEILAAALQEYDLATLVGGRTFGKGTFQEVIELDGGGALDLTVGEYLTADGTSIDGTGVRPDVRVRNADPQRRDPDGEARDPAVRRALQVVADEIAAGG